MAQRDEVAAGVLGASGRWIGTSEPSRSSRGQRPDARHTDSVQSGSSTPVKRQEASRSASTKSMNREARDPCSDVERAGPPRAGAGLNEDAESSALPWHGARTDRLSVIRPPG